jgi:hypothetical protein
VSVFSAVRSHNFPRVSKSYESFGNRFNTVIIDELANSDLSQAVKGSWHVGLFYFRGLNIPQALMPSSMLHHRSPILPTLKSSLMFVVPIPDPGFSYFLTF